MGKFVVSSDLPISLFELLRQELSGQIAPIRCTKATLVHISHTLEDIVLSHNLPALIFTGFQESSYWRKETARYRELTQVAKYVCIFAGKPLPPESNATSLHVQLTGDDPLRQEWFLIIMSEKFSVLLCGRDGLLPTQTEAQREFDTILTFDPNLLNPTLDKLEEVIGRYRPERLASLQAARREYIARTPDITFMMHFMSEMIAFEENLHRALFAAFGEQMRVNAALRAEKDFSDTLLQLSPAFFVVLDERGRVIVMNEVVLKALNYRLDEVLHKDFVRCFVAEADRTAFQSLLQNRMQGENFPYLFDQLNMHLVAQDGTQHHVEWRWRYLSGQERYGECFLGLGLDTTERDEAHRQALELAIKQEKVAALEQFIGDASHDLRTPLANIQSSLYLLSVAEEEERRRYYIQKLNTLTLHLQKMVEDLLDMTRLESEAYTFHFEALDMNELLGELVRDVEAYAQQHGLQVSFEPANCPLRMQGDMVHLMRALTNVLNNAVQYTPAEGAILVQTVCEDETIRIQVRDTGIGIPPEDLPFIFDRFYRVDKTRRMGSTGLGLSITRRIVERHNGQIWVESQEDAGTTFTLQFPMQDVSEPIGRGEKH